MNTVVTTYYEQSRKAWNGPIHHSRLLSMNQFEKAESYSFMDKKNERGFEEYGTYSSFVTTF